MNIVSILDVETTGLDPKTDVVIEVAIVRYSLLNCAVIDSFASVLKTDHPNGAESVNHIPSGLLWQSTMEADETWTMINRMAGVSGAVLAHNADFDRQWIPKSCSTTLERPWIDTCNGVKWPHESKPGASLISLALDHGLAVVDPHRALSDCLLLARLLTRVAEQHNIVELLARGLRPQATFQALVSYDDKDKAKEAGFHWDAPTKRWLRRMALEDAAQLSFKTRQIEE